MAGNVRVVCRTRPMNRKEVERGGTNILNYSVDYATMQIINPGDERMKHSFNFDRCFPPETGQAELYNYVAKPILEDIFKGYNGTLFVYGQTGSGKTHTMMGPDGGKGMEDLELKGIVPRIVMNIFSAVEQADEDLEFVVKVSFLEIYMERIRDLLDVSRDNLRVREEPGKGVWVEGATEVYCSCEDDVMNVLRLGQVHRSVAATKMNAESSRSHSIFIVTIAQKNIKTGSSKSGRLYLVDLAGSEKVGKTGAEGQTLEEAKMINKSLTALGQVINALTDPKAKHVPYRDSKLTRLLQNSLGGNSRTTLCINCSPSDYNYGETLSTLRFGQRAKSIKNQAKVNQERSVAELMAMLADADKEIEMLKLYIALLTKEILTIAPSHPIPPMPTASAKKEEDAVEKDAGDSEAVAVDAVDGQVGDEVGTPVSESSDASEGDKPSTPLSLSRGMEKLMIHSEMKYIVGSKEDEMRRELEDKLQSLKDAHENMESLQLELDRARSVEDELEKQNRYLVSKIAELELQKEQFEVDKAKSVQTIEGLAGENAVLAKEVAALEKNLSSLQEKYASQEKALQSAASSPSAARRKRVRSVKHGDDGGGETSAGGHVTEAKSAEEMEEIIEALRKENQSLLAQKMTLESVAAAAHTAPEEALPALPPPTPLDPSTLTLPDLIAKYQKLESQHAMLRQLTTQKFKEFDALKGSLLADLQTRHQKVVDLETLLDEAREQYEAALLKSGSKAKSEKKIIFLERSLEQLTQGHLKATQQNQRLQAEVGVAGKKIEARDKTILQLEQKLTNQQRQSEMQISEMQKEMKHLQAELEELKEQNEKLQVTSTRAVVNPHHARIAKPIRGGGGRKTEADTTPQAHAASAASSSASSNSGFFGGLFGRSASSARVNEPTRTPTSSVPNVSIGE